MTNVEHQAENTSPTTINHTTTLITKELATKAWTTFKRYRKLLLALTFLASIPNVVEILMNTVLFSTPGLSETVINEISNEAEQVLVSPWDTISSIVSIILGVISGWLSIGLFKAELLLLNDQKPSYSIITSASRRQVVEGIFAGLFFAFLVLIGTLLLIIPGIYIALRLSLISYYIAEGYSAIDSLKASWHVTKGHALKLFGIGVVYVGISLLGFLFFVVGMVVAIPFISLMQARVYQILKVNTPNHLKPRYA